MTQVMMMRRSIRASLQLFALSIAAVPYVAWADTVVIVAAKSSATTMTAEEIADVYLGKSSGMKPVDSTEGPARNQFYSKVAGKDEAQVKAIWSRLIFTGKATPPKVVASSAEVIQAVAADPNAIGYVDKSAVNSTVKIVYEIK